MSIETFDHWGSKRIGYYFGVHLEGVSKGALGDLSKTPFFLPNLLMGG